jgi:anti-sigma B factor antagonist
MIDLGDVSYVDSSGLAVLVGLKVSALNKGLGRLEFENLTPRIKELLNLANLTKLFSS